MAEKIKKNNFKPWSFNHKYLNHFVTMNYQIGRNLKDAAIVTRDINSNGLWCPILVPTILLLYNMMYETSPLYGLIACTSVGVLFYCAFFTLSMSVSCLVLQKPVYGAVVACSLASSFLIYFCLRQGVLFSIVFPLPTTTLFSVLLPVFLRTCPKTFTIGEAMVVNQGITLFVTLCVARVACNFDIKDDNEKMIDYLVITFLSTVGFVVTVLYVMPLRKRSVETLIKLTAAAIFVMLGVLHDIMGPTCLLRIINYLLFDRNRVQLLVFWISLIVASAAVLVFRTQASQKASSVSRKPFHLLGSLVFLSGVLAEPQLLTLASGGALGLLLYLESLRKLQIEQVSPALQSAFEIYSDEKDCGVLAMTPIYLFTGLACPLLLVPSAGTSLELLGGVLAIGIGDTAASYFGTQWGAHRWHGTNKTIEGTVFNVASQVVTVSALQLFGLLELRHAVLRTVFAATVSALVEAKTTQVDNLILPLVTIVAFQFTSILF